MQEQLLLEKGMQAEVESVQTSLDAILLLLGRRIDLATSSEGYYWDNCREVVIRIKNEVNKVATWVRP